MKKLKFFTLCFVGMVAVVFGFAACGNNTPTVASIEKADNPIVSVYTVGDHLNVGGLKIKVAFSDNTTKTKDVALHWVTGKGLNDEYIFMQSGEQTLTIKYKEKQCTFSVTVNPKTVIPAKLVSIAVNTPAKLVYNYGEELDTSTLKLDAFMDNNTKNIVSSGFSISGFDKNQHGKQEVTIGYQGKSVNFNVFVNAVVTNICVDAERSITHYELDESLQLIISVAFSDGNNINITEDSDGVATVWDKELLGEQTIDVSFGGVSTTYDITITDSSALESITVLTPAKLLYNYGDELDVSNLTLAATFGSGRTRTITEGWTVSGYNPLTHGTQALEVDLNGVKTYFDITVNAIVSEVSVDSSNSYNAYELGDSLNISIDILMTDGEVINLTESSEGIEISGYYPQALGKQTLIIVYDGVQTTFDITVYEVGEPAQILETKVQLLISNIAACNPSGGTTYNLWAALENVSTADMKIEFSSDNPSVAYNSNTGVITAGNANNTTAITTFNITLNIGGTVCEAEVKIYVSRTNYISYAWTCISNGYTIL